MTTWYDDEPKTMEPGPSKMFSMTYGTAMSDVGFLGTKLLTMIDVPRN